MMLLMACDAVCLYAIIRLRRAASVRAFIRRSVIIDVDDAWRTLQALLRQRVHVERMPT